MVIICLSSYQAIDYRYHNYSDMTTTLQALAAKYPSKASLTEIGKSGSGIAHDNVCINLTQTMSVDDS
jgi:hypothetical protein